MGLHGALKSAYLAAGEWRSEGPLAALKWFALQEAASWADPVSLPLHRRVWLWRRGFTSPCGVLYDFEAHGPAAYLSELDCYRFYRSINGDHRYLVDDKLAGHWMLADHAAHRPPAYGYLADGRLHGVAGTAVDGEPVPVREWLPRTLRREGALVLKGLRGLGGKQVRICRYDDGYLLDAEPVSEAALCRAAERCSGHLVTGYVDQHDYAESLYPDAANTVRLLTLWDGRRGELLTPAAIHRIGTDRSRPVDNWSAGGLSAAIDPETGELGAAARFPAEGGVAWHRTHPDTGSRIEGTRVPRWTRIRSTVERLARDATHVPAIGWDVVLDDAGEPVVVEANTGTDVDLVQVHRPLLADDRVRRLVARHVGSVDPPG